MKNLDLDFIEQDEWIPQKNDLILHDSKIRIINHINKNRFGTHLFYGNDSKDVCEKRECKPIKINKLIQNIKVNFGNCYIKLQFLHCVKCKDFNVCYKNNNVFHNETPNYLSEECFNKFKNKTIEV